MQDSREGATHGRAAFYAQRDGERLTVRHAGAGQHGEARSDRSTPHGTGTRLGDTAVVLADVRFDNAEEVWQALGVSGPEAAATTDEMLLLRAYARWGTVCVERFVGAFAFAIWDRRQHLVFCACDPLGFRALHHAADEDLEGWTCALTVPALLKTMATPASVDPQWVARFLLRTPADNEATAYRGVRRLPGGAALTLKADGVRQWTYWKPDDAPRVRLGSDRAYADALRDLLTTAVRSSVQAPGRVGAFLSGGLDSSSLACLARNEYAPLDTFSFVYDEESVASCDERSYIEAVLQEGGMRSHTLNGEHHHPLERLDEHLACLGEPFATPVLFLPVAGYQLARETGVSVLLDGFGGDQVIGHGLGLFTELAGRGRWMRWRKEAQAMQRSPYGRSPRWYARHYVMHPLLRDPLRHFRRRFRRPDWTHHPIGRLLRPGLLEAAGFMDAGQVASYEVPLAPWSVRGQHVREFETGVTREAIRIAGQIARHYDIDARFPFLDQRVVTWCIGLPAEQRLRRGWSRYVLREAMRGVIPEAIRTRHSKADMSPVFLQGLRGRGRGALRSLLLESSVAMPYVQPDKVAETWRRFDDGNDRAVPWTLWQIAVLTRWLEMQART